MDHQRLRSLFDMSGRVVIVTGGTRGIGLALAEGYVAAGARVVVASRKAEACAEAEEHLRRLGRTAADADADAGAPPADGATARPVTGPATGADVLGVPTHLGDLDALDQLVAHTVEAFGAIDVVVNNAATSLAQPLGGLTPEAWAKSFDVNLRGPVFLAQKALPHLTESPHAAVLNVISAGAYLFSPSTAMYSAAKAALLSFTRSLAAEWAPHGIRVNALAPGPVDTDMVRNAPPDMQAGMAAATLQRRIATADEMVGPALLLTSDAGSFITGQAVLADGGMVPH